MADLRAAKDKSPAVALTGTKDGRVYLHLSFAATLSRGKVAFLLLASLALAAYAASPTLFGENNALKRRVRELEVRLGKRVHWLLQHRQHLQEHVNSGWEPRVHPDGRKHLLSPPDGVSRLAEALAPATELADFDDHYLCGTGRPSEGDVIKKKLAIAAVSWKSPLSLRNSMESWRAGGLLDIADEKMIFLNSPGEEDRAIAAEFDFDVYTTDEQHGNILAGPALAYLVGNSSADYLLFMEKDFVLSAPREAMLREMYLGVQHLARGVDAYRWVGRRRAREAAVAQGARARAVLRRRRGGSLCLSNSFSRAFLLTTTLETPPPCYRGVAACAASRTSPLRACQTAVPRRSRRRARTSPTGRAGVRTRWLIQAAGRARGGVPASKTATTREYAPRPCVFLSRVPVRRPPQATSRTT
jgi:hypothetical protein